MKPELSTPSAAIVDCHAHLASEVFDDDRDQVLARARASGVETILVVSEHLEDARRVLEVCSGSDMLRPCLGLHPEFVPAASDEQVDALVTLIREQRDLLAAIGEVGLDYWLTDDADERTRQREVLTRFAALSNDLQLPLNVHSRSAGHYTIELLREVGARHVLMHAFDGRAHYALAGVEAGFYFSVPPSVVRSPQKQKMVKRLPLSALCLETDSPVLGPDRATRNEPANARRSAEMIAELKDVPLEQVLIETHANAVRLFGLGA